MSVSSTIGTPSQPHVVEGNSYGVEIHVYTNVGFTSVEWYMNDTLVDTHTGDGTGTYDSLSGYDFSGLGSTAGNFVTIKAIAYNGDDNATNYAYVTVWDPVEIDVYTATPEKVVGGEATTISITTNIPFTRVKYDIEFDDDPRKDDSTGPDDKESEISYTFDSVRPLPGRQSVERDITVTAYANIAGREVSSEPVTLTVNVFGRNSHVWKSVTASIDSWMHIDGTANTYELTTSHSASYYNDETDRQKLFVGKLGWYQAPNTNNWPRMQFIQPSNVEEKITLDLAYSSSVSRTLTSPVRMRTGWFYGGYSYTRFGAWDDVTREETLIRRTSDVRYQDGSTLPPTDSDTKVNPSRKAQQVAD